MVFPFPFRYCLILHSRQVEVRLLTRPLVHPIGLPFAQPIERWAEDQRKCSAERSSCLAWIVTYSLPFGSPSVIIPFLARTYGMVSPSTIVLVPYTFFCTALGSFGEFCLSKQLPGSLLFVEPNFPFGILAIPVRSVARFPGALLLHHPCAFSLTQNVPAIRRCPPVSLAPLYSSSVSAFCPLSHRHQTILD